MTRQELIGMAHAILQLAEDHNDYRRRALSAEAELAEHDQRNRETLAKNARVFGQVLETASAALARTGAQGDQP